MVVDCGGFLFSCLKPYVLRLCRDKRGVRDKYARASSVPLPDSPRPVAPLTQRCLFFFSFFSRRHQYIYTA